MTNTSSPRRGRPSLISPALIGSLVQAVEAGLNRTEAAEYAGISHRSFARWLTLGQKVVDSGVHASDFERLCGVLRTRISSVDAALKPAAEPDQESTPGLLSISAADSTVDAELLRENFTKACRDGGAGGVMVSPRAEWTSLPAMTIEQRRSRRLLSKVRALLLITPRTGRL
ncbi:hypothetical protein ACWDZ4_20200 [Streptomyces sp. NPDC003016]